MRLSHDLVGIAVFSALVAGTALVVESGVWLTFVMLALYGALLAQAWNILGGFGGQFSFGHAVFFGTGAYAQAVAQLQFGLNAWAALALAMAAAALVGAIVGALSFRYGLKGSYFALVTLAFAEVFRIVALSVDFTGAGSRAPAGARPRPSPRGATSLARAPASAPWPHLPHAPARSTRGC